MEKLKIKVITWGTLPFLFNRELIENKKSKIFKVIGRIKTLPIEVKSDGSEHEFSDDLVLKNIADAKDCDFQVVITNVPLELNWFSRRISRKTVIFTYSGLVELLQINNIPVENLTLRLLYSYSIIYKRYGNKFPLSSESTNFSHSDTRKCIFDFNGLKDDIIYSSVDPILCDYCYSKLLKENLSVKYLRQIRKELKEIDKRFYFKVKDFIEEYPVWFFFISTVWVIILGIIANVIFTQLNS